MNGDLVLWVVGFFFLSVFVGVRVWVWWVTKGKPASARIDVDIATLRSMPRYVQSPLFDDEGLLR